MESAQLIRGEETWYGSLQDDRCAVAEDQDCQQDGSSSSRVLEDEVEDVPPEARGRRERNLRLFLISVVVFLDSMAAKLHSPVVTQYTYQVITEQVYGNASIDVSISAHPCVNASDNGTDTSDADSLRDEVQDKSADLLMWLDLADGLIAVVTNIFLGAYSDSLGRKFILLLPVLGHFLRSLTTPVIIHWDLGLTAMYSGYVIDGICGGSPGIMLGLFVYTADITPSDKERTLGMALVEMAAGVATAAINYAAGLFIQETGFFYPSVVSSLFLFFCVVVIACCLPETLPRNQRKVISPVESARRMVEAFTSDELRRKRLLLSLVSLFLAYFALISISKVNSLYLMNTPFCWDSTRIGIFEALRSGVGSLSSIALVGLLQPVVSTPGLTIMGAASCTAFLVLFGLARTDLMVYMVPVVGFASSVIFPTIRSMMSRMVPADKQGAMFGGIAVVESVSIAAGPLAVMSLYTHTEPTLHGLTYFCVGGLYLLVIGIFLTFMPFWRKTRSLPETILNIQADDTES